MRIMGKEVLGMKRVVLVLVGFLMLFSLEGFSMGFLGGGGGSTGGDAQVPTPWEGYKALSYYSDYRVFESLRPNEGPMGDYMWDLVFDVHNDSEDSYLWAFVVGLSSLPENFLPYPDLELGLGLPGWSSAVGETEITLQALVAGIGETFNMDFQELSELLADLENLFGGYDYLYMAYFNVVNSPLGPGESSDGFGILFNGDWDYHSPVFYLTTKDPTFSPSSDPGFGYNYTPQSVVPEPASGLLLAVGLALIGIPRRRY